MAISLAARDKTLILLLSKQQSIRTLLNETYSALDDTTNPYMKTVKHEYDKYWIQMRDVHQCERRALTQLETYLRATNPSTAVDLADVQAEIDNHAPAHCSSIR